MTVSAPPADLLLVLPSGEFDRSLEDGDAVGSAE